MTSTVSFHYMLGIDCVPYDLIKDEKKREEGHLYIIGKLSVIKRLYRRLSAMNAINLHTLNFTYKNQFPGHR